MHIKKLIIYSNIIYTLVNIQVYALLFAGISFVLAFITIPLLLITFLPVSIRIFINILLVVSLACFMIIIVTSIIKRLITRHIKVHSNIK